MNSDDRGSLPEVVVVGSAHMDLVARAVRLPSPGESLLGAEFAMYPGGKAGNQAVAAAQQGAHTAIIARVGDDALGRDLKASLARKNVDVTFLEVASDERTGVSPVLMAANGDYASIIVPGASGGMTPMSLAAASDVLRHCAVLMLQLEIAPGVNEAAAHLADRAVVALNAAPAPAIEEATRWALWRFVDVIIVNREEARALSNAAVADARDPQRIARRLRQTFDVPSVVMTLGPEGAVVADDAGEIHIPGFDALAVDTIGAGDAFAGAVAAALARGTGLREAVVLGNAAGALAVTRRGAHDAAPTLEESMRLAAPRLEAATTR